MSGLTFLAACLAIVGADIKDDAKKAANIESGSKWCPIMFAGTECPPSGFAWHYKCCGELNNHCCFHLQTWAWILLIILVIVLLASLALGLVRFLFCRRK
uniref:Uncharacterized protein n=1 Tax=Panagrolaimus sp. JU765 TaxID=591449 RepID=A0AC34QKH9_9BILA